MSRVRLWERLSGVGVEMASSARLLVEALRVRDLRRVLGAYLAFNVAEMANFIAILIYAYEVGGSPALGLVAFLTLAPAAVFAPVGATLGDRFRREVMLTVAYALFAATSAAVAIALYVEWPVGVIYFLAAVNATVLTLVRPLHESLLPALARSTEQLAAGYVAGGSIENLGWIVGPLLAGLTAAAWGTSAVFVITTVLLLNGTILVWGVKTTTAAEPGTGQNAVQMTLEGFGAFRESRPKSHPSPAQQRRLPRRCGRSRHHCSCIRGVRFRRHRGRMAQHLYWGWCGGGLGLGRRAHRP